MRVSVIVASLVLCGATLAAQETNVSRLLLPAIGSAPETGIQLGLVVMQVRRPAGGARPTVDKAYALLTAKHQYQVTYHHDGWSAADRWHHVLKIDLLDYPLPFYGVGSTAAESAEEMFTARTAQLTARLQRRLNGPLYGMVLLRALDTRIAKTAAGGVIASGALPGARGGRLVQPGIGLTYDTRDDVIGAESGRFVDASFSVADGAVGSEFATNHLLVDARAYRRLGPGVIAMQGYLDVNAGTPSFDQMSLVGSDVVLRGYTLGRYRDRALAAAQLEWRAPLYKRWRYAAFAGIGTIGGAVGKLGDIALPSYGVGLRFRPFKNERSLLRLDYARGRRGQSGLYIAIDEAF